MGLPEGWAVEKLGSIVVVERGSSPRPIKKYLTDDMDGVSWVKIGDATKSIKVITETKEKITKEGAKKSRFVDVGDFILTNSMSYGHPYIMGIQGYIHDGWFVLRLPKEINSGFFYYLLSSPNLARQFELLAVGGVVKNISGDLVKKAELPIPPLNEQIRIANKLDSLLAKVETAQSRLEKIPVLLKRFRQSVLAAATSGELTREWRSSVETVSWQTFKLEDLAKIKDPHPSHRTPKVVSDGVPYIGIGDLKNDGEIDFENARKVSFDILQEHNKRYSINEGDFVFGKIGTLGKATKLPMGIDFTLSANVILVQPDSEKILAAYLMGFLSSPTTMREVAKQASSTSQAAFGIKKMRSFVAHIPPIEEQAEIVRRVESLFAQADKVESQYKAAKIRLDKLTQSILAKAFRGELVPQDPNDEPASELLKRIQAEREQQPKTKPKRTRKVA